MDEALAQGIRAAQSGDRARAVALLAEFVKTDPDSEQGWLWLGHSLEDSARRQFCYQKVLAINPSNKDAERWLKRLASQPDLAQRKKEKTQIIALVLLIIVALALIIYIFLTGNSRPPIAFFGKPVNFSSAATATHTSTPAPAPETASAPLTPTSLLPASPTAQQITPTNNKPVQKAKTAIPAEKLLAQSTALIEQDEYYPAITILDQLIAQDKKNSAAYYQRAICYFNLRDGDGYLGRSQFNIAEALKNIDIAIALEPTNGDYYSLRSNIYTEIASIEEYDVNRKYLYGLALENAQKAQALGTTLNPYPERAILGGLVYTNNCQEALRRLQASIDVIPKDDASIGGLLVIQSQIYACLGRLDEAIQVIDRAMLNNQNLPYKKELKIIYLFQRGSHDEALILLNELFICCEYRGGLRYYIRAAIHYGTGKRGSTLQDLENGKENTWLRGGLLPYVEAQMALDDGDKEEAIRLLQIAVATFDPLFNTMRLKALKELEQLGARPLDLMPSAPYQATPIP